MKPTASESVLTLDNAEAEIEMSIDLSSIAFIMRQLTDLYSDPILACVREYSTNANDSHSHAGTTRPIVITLPSVEDLNFTVEDWGMGMSRQDIIDVYSKYGASTGRDTNDVTGMLGFGSKSAMTYGNSFRVEATKDGRTLQAVVTKSDDDIPRIKFMAEYETVRDNGVKITIPVKQQDVGDWHERATHFYKYWRDPVLVDGEAPRTFNEMNNDYVQVEPDIWVKLEERGYGSDTTAVFVQGNVPYPLDMTEYTKGKVGGSDVFVCYVETGLVDFTPSREALMHTDRTNELIEVARQCARESMKRHIATIGQGLSVFERFKLGFKLPNAYNPLDALNIRKRHYGPGDYAIEFKAVDNQGKINKPAYSNGSDHLMREFTGNTLALAKGSDGEHRFVKNFSFRRVSERHLRSLLAHHPQWEHDQYPGRLAEGVVFLPKSTDFDTDSFPGVDWREVPLLPAKKGPRKPKAPVFLQVVYADAPHYEVKYENVDLDNLEELGDAVLMTTGYVSRDLPTHFPGVRFIQVPTDKKDVKRFEESDARKVLTSYAKWRKLQVAELSKQLTTADRRWIAARTEHTRLTRRFAPYAGSITNPAWRKLMLKAPEGRRIMDKLSAINALGDAMTDKQRARFEQQSREAYKSIEEQFTLVTNYQSRHYGRDLDDAEFVVYINGKGRQRNLIVQDETIELPDHD